MGVALIGTFAFLFCAIAVAQARIGISYRIAVKSGHHHKKKSHAKKQAPAPGGPPPGYKLLFEDAFERGSLANFVIGEDNTGSISLDAATGTATLRIPAGAGDAREELSINEPNQLFSDGDRFILEAERWLPEGTVPGGTGSHFTFAQFKGDRGQFPMISSEYASFSYSGTGFYVLDKNLPTTSQSYKIADYAPGTWHTESIFVSVSNSRSGSYSFTVDGQKSATVSGVNTLEPVDTYGYMKIGVYGQPQGKAVETKLRNVRMYVPE